MCILATNKYQTIENEILTFFNMHLCIIQQWNWAEILNLDNNCCTGARRKGAQMLICWEDNTQIWLAYNISTTIRGNFNCFQHTYIYCYKGKPMTRIVPYHNKIIFRIKRLVITKIPCLSINLLEAISTKTCTFW